MVKPRLYLMAITCDNLSCTKWSNLMVQLKLNLMLNIVAKLNG
jgi:hypothetical protein